MQNGRDVEVRMCPTSSIVCLLILLYGQNYLIFCVSGVSPSNIKKAVDFAMEQRRLGRAVLVHCAHGHGRSAGVILACMIVAGDVPNIDDGVPHTLCTS